MPTVRKLPAGTVFIFQQGTPGRLAIKGPGDVWSWLHEGRFSAALANNERLDEQVKPATSPLAVIEVK